MRILVLDNDMKNIVYIGFLAIVLLFSCSKEQPLSPTFPSTTVESSQLTGDTEVIVEGEDNSGINQDDSFDSDITDPEDEEKEKTNKKAKI